VTPAAVEPAEFRQLLGRFTTGVCVLTARTADGRLQGMTANSLSSISLLPPLVLVSIDHQAQMHPTLTTCAAFAINILSAGQEAVSRRFANDHEDRFDGVGYHESPRGLVLLDGALAHLECDVVSHFDAGDHTIFIASVERAEPRHGRPLLYYRGGYAQLER